MAGVKAGTAYIDVQGDFSALNKQIDAAVAPISEKFGKLGKAGAVGLAAIGAAAVGAGAALYDIGGQFDDAYDTIRVGTGKTGKALKGLEGDFKAVVKTVPTDFGSASTAISQLNSRLGITGKPLRSLSGQVLELSRITKTDLSGNIESVTRLFGDWGVKTKNQAGALDKLFRASQATNVPISKLSDLMTKFGGPLRQLGFGFNQVAALVGKFQKEGVNTELVMGSLRIALGRMAKEGVKDPQEALQKLTAQIKNAGSAGEANKLALETFGARAGPDMAAAIREGRFEIGDLQKTIAGGKDTIMGASKDTQDFGEKWQLIKNRVLVGLEPLATAVFGAVGTAMDKLPGIVDAVSGAFNKFKDGLGGGEGGGFASKAAQSFQQLKDAVVTTFTTIVTVGGALWRTFGDTIVDHLKDTVTMVAGVLQGVITAFKGIVDIISGVLTGDWGKAWTGVKEVFSGVWQAIGAVVTGAWENIKTIVSLGVTAIGTIIKAAAGALLDLGKWIVGKIAEGLKAYAQLWIDAAGWIKNRIVDALKAVGGAFLDAGKFVVNRVAEGVKTVTGALSDVGGWIKNRIVEFVQREASGLVNVGTWIVNRVAEGAKTLTDGLASVGGWLKNRLLDGVEAVKDGFTGVGGSVIGWIVKGLTGGLDKVRGFVNDIIRVLNKGLGFAGIKIPLIAAGSSIDVEARATGGQIRRGTKLNQPVIMMGEEAPRHPEFVIPTNPAYRGRALGLYNQLGQELGVNAFATGGVIGKASGLLSDVAGGVFDVAKGVLNLPAKLLAKGASLILDQLPNPADMLPGWLKGIGKYAISKVGGWVKDKVSDLFNNPVTAMTKRMNEIDARGGPYKYGGGHGDGGVNGFDCSGLVSEILRAGGFLKSPITTDGLKVFGEGGDGKLITIGVRGSTGRQAHTMMKLGDRYLESGSGHGAKWVNGWSGGFPIHRHPVGFAKGGILSALGLDDPSNPLFAGWGLAQGGQITGPFVGSYKNGGVIPRDGLAYVHQGETVTPGGPFDGAVFQLVMGGQVIDERIELKIIENSRRQGAEYRAGARA